MAIVNSTNEALNDRNPVSERLLSRAGPELRKELKRTVVSKFKEYFLNLIINIAYLSQGDRSSFSPFCDRNAILGSPPPIIKMIVYFTY